MEIAKKLDNKLLFSIALGNMGDIYYDEGNYIKAMEYYQKKLEIVEGLNHKRSISITLFNIGNIYKKLKNYEKAEEYYNRAITIAKELQTKYYLCIFLHSKADLYYLLQKYDEANLLNNESLKLAEELNKQGTIFNRKVLKAKIKSIKDKTGAISELEKMLKIEKENEEKAILHYELFKLTKEEEHRRIAIDIYQKLYEKTPSIEYKERIEELKI